MFGNDGLSSVLIASLVTPILNKILDFFLIAMPKLYMCVIYLYKKIMRQNINPSCLSLQLYSYDKSTYWATIDYDTELLNCILWNLTNNIKTTGAFVIPAETLGIKINHSIPINKVIIEINKQTTDKQNTNVDCSIKQLSKMKINKHIFIDMVLVTDTMNYTILRNKMMKILCNIYSYTKNNDELNKFYEHIKSSYATNYRKTNPTPVITLHRFDNNDQPIYQTFAIDRHQTFDNIFSEHKQMLLTELDKLNDKRYFDKFGLKRKMGYMFVGQPGSGKTAFVSAIANYTNRIVISISLNKIKTNDQLRDVLYSRRFCGKDYEPDQLIILFDEIEKSVFFNPLPKTKDESKLLIVKDEKNDKKSETDDNDKLDEATFLGLLDGIYDQDGRIILATANDVSKINNAFIRDGRLKLLNINYADNKRITEMIEFYGGHKVTHNELAEIRDDKKIQTMTIKKIILSCVEKKMSTNDIIRQINDLNP